MMASGSKIDVMAKASAVGPMEMSTKAIGSMTFLMVKA